jgi:hypothetical protein
MTDLCASNILDNFGDPTRYALHESVVRVWQISRWMTRAERLSASLVLNSINVRPQSR